MTGTDSCPGVLPVLWPPYDILLNSMEVVAAGLYNSYIITIVACLYRRKLQEQRPQLGWANPEHLRLQDRHDSLGIRFQSYGTRLLQLP